MRVIAASLADSLLSQSLETAPACTAASYELRQSPVKSAGSFRRAISWLLLAGILIRLAVLIAAEPDNPDFHAAVIEYIADHRSLPVSNLLNQSYQPPLYYVLMAPLWAVWHSKAPIHFVSFVLSCANLLMIRRLLFRREVTADSTARVAAFALACFMPEFVMFSGFISNDALTLPLGTLLFLCTLNYIHNPSMKWLAALASLLGLCLLTKGTFLATGFALAGLVGIIESRNGLRITAMRVAIFCTIWSVLGCYKYVDNAVRLGHPFVHNLDAMPREDQGKFIAYRGLQTLYDINIIKLIRSPIAHPGHIFSYPLLMYGTFWYPHVPESSFRGNVFGYDWVGSITYAVAVVPTLMFLIGVARGAMLSMGVLRVPRAQWHMQIRGLVAMAAMLMLFSNLAVVFAAGIKYDNWWCFQSRLCFQSMMPILCLFGLGMEVMPKAPRLRTIIAGFCFATAACGVLYFVVEVALVYSLLPPGREMLP